MSTLTSPLRLASSAKSQGLSPDRRCRTGSSKTGVFRRRARIPTAGAVSCLGRWSRAELLRRLERRGMGTTEERRRAIRSSVHGAPCVGDQRPAERIASRSASSAGGTVPGPRADSGTCSLVRWRASVRLAATARPTSSVTPRALFMASTGSEGYRPLLEGHELCRLFSAGLRVRRRTRPMTCRSGGLLGDRPSSILGSSGSAGNPYDAAHGE